MKKINYIIMALMLIGIVSAVQESIFTFTDNATGSLDFNGTQNKTKYITLPRYVDITAINITLYGKQNYSWYYKENNDSFYLYDGVWNLTNISDGNWDTFVELPNGAYWYYNYSVPVDSSTNAILQLKLGGSGTTNITLTNCLKNPIQFSFDYTGDFFVSCRVNVAVFQTIGQFTDPSDKYFYEDGVYIWTKNANYSTNYPKDIAIQVGTFDGTKEWNHTATFNTTINAGLNISSTNAALNKGACDCTNCSLSEDYCTIPIYFTSTGGIINYSNINFTYRYGIDVCAGNQTLNFSIYDEQAITTTLNATAYVVGDYWINASNKTAINYTFSNHYNYALCIYPSWMQFYSDIYIRYTTDYGYTHRYYMVNTTLSNSTTYLNLYNFNTTTGISQLEGTVRFASTYNVFPDVYAKLQKYYPATNTWLTVQMDKSDSFGQIFFNIIEESEDYRIVFEYEGIEIYNTGTLKFICSSGICSLTFTMDATASSTPSVYMNPTYTYNNNTGMITISWDDSSDSIDNVTFEVTANDISTMTVICYNMTTNQSGTFSCNVSGYYGQIKTVAKEIGSIDTFISEIEHRIRAGILDSSGFVSDTNLQKDATFWVGGILATITLGAAAFSPIAAVVMLIFGLISISFLGFSSMITIVFITPVIIIGIIVSILVRR